VITFVAADILAEMPTDSIRTCAGETHFSFFFFFASLLMWPMKREVKGSTSSPKQHSINEHSDCKAHIGYEELRIQS